MKISGPAVSDLRSRLALWCALFAGLILVQAAWAQPAGRIGTTQRLVWQQKPDGTINPIAKGATFETGDMISTGRGSSAQLLFSDGGEITMRPDSQLRIEQYGYRAESPPADDAFFRLLKGGMRAVTGLIGKRGNQDAYRVGAMTATIGVRGTDFTTRICGDDCAQESKKFQPTDRTPVPIPAARIVLTQGRIFATSAKGVTRDVEQTSAIYQGDTVRTAPDGYAILVFRDEGRMTLAANTVFTVEQFRYQQVRPEQNSVVFRLLQGGLRSITGLIARRKPEAYRINTVTATIGVRGTHVGINVGPVSINVNGDSNGASATVTSSGDPSKTAEQIKAEAEAFGLVVHTWDGTAFLDTAAGRFEVNKDQTIAMTGRDSKPVYLPKAPAVFDESRLPPPDKIDFDMKDLFAIAPDKYEPGLYVYVREGRIRLSDAGRDLIVEQGEGGYVDGKGGPPFKVEPPMSLKFDPWLQQASNICW